MLYQGINVVAGESFSLSGNNLIFGAQRTGTNLGSQIGALQLNGTDALVMNAEVGAVPASTGGAQMWNQAVLVGGAGNKLVNIVAEGSDIGVRVTGSNNELVNVRADLNYGHGFSFIRDNAGSNLPNDNSLTQCFGHRNSRHATNTYDNFIVGAASSSNTLVGCRSSYSSGDGWSHRYGLNDNGSGTKIVGFRDTGAGTRWIKQNNTSGIDNTSTDGAVGAVTGATFDVSRYNTFRVTNAGATNVTSITGGVHGQIITLQPTDNNTTINNTGTGADQITNTAGANRALVSFGLYRYQMIFQTWYQCV
jgi:hypothetical protein